jgi:hypothetical protein
MQTSVLHKVYLSARGTSMGPDVVKMCKALLHDLGSQGIRDIANVCCSFSASFDEPQIAGRERGLQRGSEQGLSNGCGQSTHPSR